MKFTEKTTAAGALPLLNDHFVAIPYNCTEVTATNGVIPAGTVVPANDGTAVGILLQDVIPAENPNGAAIVHGFIDAAKLPVTPAAAAAAALKNIYLANYTAPEEPAEEETPGGTE